MIMKLSKIMISLVAFVAILVTGCNGDINSSSSSLSSTSIQEDVSEVVFNMPNTVLVPGSYTLIASCLPESSSQLVKFNLLGSVEGVSLSGTELLVSVSAVDN
jgi:predicted small secreted protein